MTIQNPLIAEMARKLCKWRNGKPSDVPFEHLSEAEQAAYISQATDAYSVIAQRLEAQNKAIERAIMLMETAWMDEEPLPCEWEARNTLKALLPTPPQREDV